MSKLLIVDDEQLVREAVISLSSVDSLSIDQVFEAANGQEAIETVARENPDVIVTDMRMPTLDGADFLKTLESMACRARMIVISGYLEYRYVRQSVRSNVVDYIQKPIDKDELNDAIAAALGLCRVQKGYQPDRIEYIRRYIDQNCSKRMSLSDLSQQFYWSKEHLARKFKKAYQMTVRDYVRHIRLQRACELIRDNCGNFKEIAFLVGFHDQNYFSRAFRAKYGITPTNYLKSIRSTR